MPDLLLKPTDGGQLLTVEAADDWACFQRLFFATQPQPVPPVPEPKAKAMASYQDCRCVECNSHISVSDVFPIGLEHGTSHGSNDI